MAEICLVVDLTTGKVVNSIMADPLVDLPPKGYALVARPEQAPVDVNWILSAGKFEPTVELQAMALTEGKTLDPVDAGPIVEKTIDDKGP